jgi:hypothetical protein
MPAALDPETRLKQTGRNDDCLCGSGKKYKKCHLREDEEAVSKALALKLAESVKAAAAEGEHVHDESCEHPAQAPGVKHQASAAPVMSAPNKPMSHKPVTTPRKAV